MYPCAPESEHNAVRGPTPVKPIVIDTLIGDLRHDCQGFGWLSRYPDMESGLLSHLAFDTDASAVFLNN